MDGFVAGKSYNGAQGVVTGWGVTVQNGAPSEVLNEVTVPIMSNPDCKKTAYGEKKITDNMMCAGYPEGKKDSCQVRNPSSETSRDFVQPDVISIHN